jgi:hypothetical protein
MQHTSIVHTNLNNILGPSFNQVPLDHLHNVSYVFCVTQSINAPKNSLSAKETHIIFKTGWLLAELQPSLTTICSYEYPSFLCVIEKLLAYVGVQGGEVRPPQLQCHLQCFLEAHRSNCGKWNVGTI